MNKQVLRKWVDALRSGDYEQGTEYLAAEHEDGKVHYCCLGVLCKLAVEEGICKQSPLSDIVPAISEFDGDTAILPRRVMEWIGVEETDPMVYPSDSGGRSLTYLNDTAEWDFKRIADLLERDYLHEENNAEQ